MKRPAAKEVAQEVKALIHFYERRGADWLLAAEFTLARHSTPRSDAKQRAALQQDGGGKRT